MYPEILCHNNLSTRLSTALEQHNSTQLYTANTAVSAANTVSQLFLYWTWTFVFRCSWGVHSVYALTRAFALRCIEVCNHFYVLTWIFDFRCSLRRESVYLLFFKAGLVIVPKGKHWLSAAEVCVHLWGSRRVKWLSAAKVHAHFQGHWHVNWLFRCLRLHVSSSWTWASALQLQINPYVSFQSLILHNCFPLLDQDTDSFLSCTVAPLAIDLS